MWIPAPEFSVKERLAEICDAVTSPEVSAFAGVQWFQTGNSRRQALRRPFEREKLAKLEAWRRVSLGGPEYLRLDLWNGGGPPVEATLYLSLPLEQTRLNVFSVAQFGHREDTAQPTLWEDTVAATRALASRMGGVCMLGAPRLGRRATEMSVPYPAWSAYLLAWGRDRSGENADVAWLSEGRNEPGTLGMALVPGSPDEDVEIARFARALPARR